MRRMSLVVGVFFLSFVSSSFSGTVKIDGGSSYATIQAAVDAAVSGDRILISTGVFCEAVAVWNKDLTLEGGYDEGLVSRPGGFTGLTSSNQSSVIWFNISSSHVDQVSFFHGIANGFTLGYGGGCVMNQSWVEFNDSSIFSNQAIYGGGLFVDELSQAILTGRSRIYDNIALWRGGGVHVKGMLDILHEDSDIVHNIVSNGYGGGIFLEQAYLQISQGDILDNIAAGTDTLSAGGGIAAISSELVLGDGLYISNNMAFWGGGLSLLDSTAHVGRATSADVMFNHNTAWYGGGLQAWTSEINLRGALFRDNAVTTSGGAAFLWDSRVSSDTNRLIVLNNHAALDGGGFYLANCQANWSAVSFGDGLEPGNEAGNSGGGLYLTNSAVHIYGGQFIGNRSGFSVVYTNGQGGAIAAYRSGLILTNGPGLDGLYTNVVFRHNQASNYFGGAVYLGDESHINFHNGFAEGNQATDGGMLYASPACAFLFVNCTLTGNTAMTDGGAIAARGDGTIHDCRFLNNTAGRGGGGIQLDRCMMEISQSSFIRNVAAYSGGGVHCYDAAFVDINTPADEPLYSSTSGWRSLFLGNRPEGVSISFRSTGTLSRVAFISNDFNCINVLSSQLVLKESLVDGYSSMSMGLTSSTGTISSCTLFGGINVSAASGLSLSNTILVGSISTSDTSRVVADYCCTPAELRPGTGNITNAPILYANYHQRANSPTINAGSAVDDPFLLDMDAESRVGATSDIGCDEFVDEDNDGLPSYMETGTGHIENEFDMGSNPLNPDTDGDGFGDNDEWWADTDPNQAGSCLRISRIENEGPYLRLYWQGGERVLQYLEESTDMFGEWSMITILTPPTATATNFTVNNHLPNVQYRLRTYRQ